MDKSVYLFGLLCLAAGHATVYAQKGQPPKEETHVQVVTHFPQHEDFNDAFISRIIVS